MKRAAWRNAHGPNDARGKEKAGLAEGQWQQQQQLGAGEADVQLPQQSSDDGMSPIG